jgi:hypothetical protein
MELSLKKSEASLSGSTIPFGGIILQNQNTAQAYFLDRLQIADNAPKSHTDYGADRGKYVQNRENRSIITAVALIHHVAKLLLVVLLLAWQQANAASSLLWSIDSLNNLLKVNPSTASSTVVGRIGNPWNLTGLAYGEGNLWSIDSLNNLLKVNPSTASSTVIGRIGNPWNLTSLAYGDGNLWSIDSLNNLLKVNPSTASSAVIGRIGNPWNLTGLAYEEQWTITTSSSPSNGGTASGSGTYNDGTAASVMGRQQTLALVL